MLQPFFQVSVELGSVVFPKEVLISNCNSKKICMSCEVNQVVLQLFAFHESTPPLKCCLIKEIPYFIVCHGLSIHIDVGSHSELVDEGRVNVFRPLSQRRVLGEGP